MLKGMRVGLYSPYFGSVYGGGEKYLACAARALKDEHPELAVDIVAPVPPDPAAYRRILGVDLDGIGLVSTNRRVTPVHRVLNRIGALRPWRDRVLRSQASRASSAYDVFLPMVYAIPVAASGRRNAMLCQFPYRSPGPEVSDYQLIVCQSEYVRGWVQRYWNREATVVNPPIDVPGEEPEWEAKENVIVSVGRFFSGGHSKRQDVLVEVFRQLVDNGLTGWELHLVGSVHRDAHHRGYFEGIAERARGYPVGLHPDLEQDGLRDLYRKAAIYWHAAGYGQDPAVDPDRLEHFGMSTAEAMANGACPIVHGSGGQLEVVRDGVDGRHWLIPDELAQATLDLIWDGELRGRLAREARRSAQRWSRPRFASAIRESLQAVLL